MIEASMTEAAIAIGAGLAALLTGLGLGIKRGRILAIQEGDPAVFSQVWMERAERAFKKVHADATVITEHSFKIAALEGKQEKAEGMILVRAAELENELHLLNTAVMAMREDLAALRGEMGFERRRGVREP